MKIVSTWMKIHFPKKKTLLYVEWVHPTPHQVDKVWIFIWKPPCFHHRHLHDVCIFFMPANFSVASKINCIMDICDKGVVLFLTIIINSTNLRFHTILYIFHFEHLMRDEGKVARNLVRCAGLFYFHGLVDIIGVEGGMREVLR